MDLGEKTWTPMHKLEKHIGKNRISVVHPDPMNIESEVDWLINFLFDVRDANPDFKCVFVCDDSPECNP